MLVICHRVTSSQVVQANHSVRIFQAELSNAGISFAISLTRAVENGRGSSSAICCAVQIRKTCRVRTQDGAGSGGKTLRATRLAIIPAPLASHTSRELRPKSSCR